MTNSTSYKGYSARIDYDDEDGIFTGQIAGIRDGVGVHADNVEALREAFHEAVEDYIESCARLAASTLRSPIRAVAPDVLFAVAGVGYAASCKAPAAAP